MVFKQLPLLVDVFLAVDRGIDVEVVAPAGEFETVVAHFFRERGQFFEGEIGPLAGEQGDGAWHGFGGVADEERRRDLRSIKPLWASALSISQDYPG